MKAVRNPRFHHPFILCALLMKAGKNLDSVTRFIMRFPSKEAQPLIAHDIEIQAKRLDNALKIYYNIDYIIHSDE